MAELNIISIPSRIAENNYEKQPFVMKQKFKYSGQKLVNQHKTAIRHSDNRLPDSSFCDDNTILYTNCPLNICMEDGKIYQYFFVS